MTDSPKSLFEPFDISNDFLRRSLHLIAGFEAAIACSTALMLITDAKYVVYGFILFMTGMSALGAAMAGADWWDGFVDPKS